MLLNDFCAIARTVGVKLLRWGQSILPKEIKLLCRGLHLIHYYCSLALALLVKSCLIKLQYGVLSCLVLSCRVYSCIAVSCRFLRCLVVVACWCHIIRAHSISVHVTASAVAINVVVVIVIVAILIIVIRSRAAISTQIQFPRRSSA